MSIKSLARWASLEVLENRRMFANIGSFAVGKVPAFAFADGQNVSFTVTPPAGVNGIVSARVTTPGYGTPSVSTAADGTQTFNYALPVVGSSLVFAFNPKTGAFSYTPDADDRFDFELEFGVPGLSSVGLPYAQRLTVQPKQRPSESDLVSNSTSNLPNAESSDFITTTVRAGSVRRFNAVDNVPTRQVEITGKTVVIAPGHANGLYERFTDYAAGAATGAQDIESLVIHAERVVIGGVVNLPQTNLTIFARELTFVDQNGATARISTRPLDNVIGKADQYRNGTAGESAGNVTLKVEKLIMPGTATRFVLNGGNGQAAGEGQNGRDGDSLPVVAVRDGNQAVGVFRDAHWTNNPFDNIDKYGYWKLVRGNESWPTDGINATPGGTPGNGGAAGTLAVSPGISGLALGSTVTANGGLAGAPASTRYGGTGGSPRQAFWFQERPVGSWTGRKYSLGYWQQRNSSDGANWYAPGASNGDVGDVTSTGVSATAWITPSTVRPMVNYVKDAYLAGNIEYAKTGAAAVLAVLDRVTTPPADQVDVLNQLRADTEIMRARAAAGLDYFGNPPGWTPMLSFLSNLSAYEREIDSALRIKFFMRLVENAASKGESVSAAISKALGQLDEELEQSAAVIAQQQELLPGLQDRVSALTTAINSFEAKLKVKEAELAKQAADNLRPPVWKRALGILGTIAQVIPVGQPALGLIGTGLNVVSNLSSEPLEAIGQIKGVVDTFKDAGSKLQTTRDNFGKYVDNLKPPTNASAAELKAYANKVAGLGKEWAGAIKSISNAFSNNTAPRSAIEAELAKLKAQDATFAGLVDELTSLNAQKEIFARDVAEALKTLGNSMSQVGNDQLSALALNRQQSDLAGTLDRATAEQVREMGRRADERLLRYQYYMAKSYEYETLKAYNGGFKLAKLSAKIGEILAGSNGATYLDSPANFEALKLGYVNDLKTISDQILTAKNTDAARREKVSVEFKITPAQLDELDAKGFVTINLVDLGVIAQTEDAAKLIALGATEISAAPVTGVGTARVKLTFEHAGKSKVEKLGRVYQFQHTLDEATPLLVGTTNYDAVLKRTPTQTEPDPADVAQLAYLLGNLPNKPEVLYAQPGAWADVVIRKEVVTRGVKIDFKDIVFQATYSYENAPSNRATLEVDSGGTLVSVATAGEASGRTDGRGVFNRSYAKNAVTTLFAQPAFGNQLFSKWVDDTGKTLGTTSKLSVTMNGDKFVKPVYVAAVPISGRVFADTDKDGVFDTNEAGIPNVNVWVDLDNDNVADANEPAMRTAGDGSYAFTVLPQTVASTVRLRAQTPTGATATTPTGGNGFAVTLTAGSTANTGKRFGFSGVTVTPPTGSTFSVAGVVYNDANKNGVRDVGETGKSGVKVWMDIDGDKTIDTGELTTTTASDGSYSFGAVPVAGTSANTRVRVELPSGTIQVGPTNGAGYTLTTTAGFKNVAKDFGLASGTTAPTGTISGIIFGDENGNGIYDAGDAVGSRQVWLDLDDDGIVDASEPSQMSATDGKFSFTGLAPRTYHVRRVYPAGRVESTPPRYITIPSTGGVFGNVLIGSKRA